MDGNILETYKFLIEQQELALDFDEEEDILNQLEKLWVLMSTTERIEAEHFIEQLLPH